MGHRPRRSIKADRRGPWPDRETVRRQPLRIDEALHRSLAHTAYHVGQIVYLAKAMRGDAWRTLSIPKGKSEEYNRSATRETAAAHAEMLKSDKT